MSIQRKSRMDSEQTSEKDNEVVDTNYSSSCIDDEIQDGYDARNIIENARSKYIRRVILDDASSTSDVSVNSINTINEPQPDLDIRNALQAARKVSRQIVKSLSATDDPSYSNTEHGSNYDVRSILDKLRCKRDYRKTAESNNSVVSSFRDNNALIDKIQVNSVYTRDIYESSNNINRPLLEDMKSDTDVSYHYKYHVHEMQSRSNDPISAYSRSRNICRRLGEHMGTTATPYPNANLAKELHEKNDGERIICQRSNTIGLISKNNISLGSSNLNNVKKQDSSDNARSLHSTLRHNRKRIMEDTHAAAATSYPNTTIFDETQFGSDDKMSTYAGFSEKHKRTVENESSTICFPHSSSGTVSELQERCDDVTDDYTRYRTLYRRIDEQQSTTFDLRDESLGRCNDALDFYAMSKNVRRCTEKQGSITFNACKHDNTLIDKVKDKSDKKRCIYIKDLVAIGSELQEKSDEKRCIYQRFSGDWKRITENDSLAVSNSQYPTSISIKANEIRDRCDNARNVYPRFGHLGEQPEEQHNTTFSKSKHDNSAIGKVQQRTDETSSAYQRFDNVYKRTVESDSVLIHNSTKSNLSYHNTDMVNEMQGNCSNSQATSGKDFSDTVIALDCEMVSVGIKNKSALARVSIVSYNGSTIYDKYVRPNEPITNYRTVWSGIRESDMEIAISMQQAQQEVRRIIRNKIIVGHDLANDFRALEMNVSSELKRDTATYAEIRKASRLKLNTKPSLKKLAARLLDKNIQVGEHSSVEDARVTMEIYRIFSDRWEKEMNNRASIRRIRFNRMI